MIRRTVVRRWRTVFTGVIAPAMMLGVWANAIFAAAPTQVVHRSPDSGLAKFITGPNGGAIEVMPMAPGQAATAFDFVRTHGAQFGITVPAQQLVERETRTSALGTTHVTFQQVHQGVPVFGAELKVHRDAGGRFTAANGDIHVIPAALDATPKLTAVAAELVARRALGRGAPIAEVNELTIVDPGWYGDPPRGARLAYYIVLTDAAAQLREAYFVDAHNGGVLDRWNVLHTARIREVYDAMGTASLPGTLVRSEGEPEVVEPDANRAYDLAGDTYDFFFRAYGRDSLDAAGRSLVATVNSTRAFCPNAFWNGTQAAFCPGTTADDIVAHELTHGVVQYTANLIYQNQSGQLNESFADIFGELIDLYNGDASLPGPPIDPPLWPSTPTGAGTDSPNLLRSDVCSVGPDFVEGYRWLVGEDAAPFGGPIRDMWNPPCMGHPDYANSPLQTCSGIDNGGVHSGSGVANHAFAMLSDGKTFNNRVVNGIGPLKAGAVFYRALVVYLTPASDFADAYIALKQAANDLVGTTPNDPRTGLPSDSAFTFADALEVDKALLAVEMNTRGACGAGSAGPVNDDCLRAACLLDGSTTSGSTVGATGGEISTCGFDDSLDAWFEYAPTFNEEVTFSLCGSDFDTTLSVYDACGGAELACADDTCVSDVLDAELTIPLIAGEIYLVRVAGFAGQSGNFTLRVQGGGGGCVGCDLPARPNDPMPALESTAVPLDSMLVWGIDSNPDDPPVNPDTCNTSYDVLLDTVSPPVAAVCSGIPDQFCTPPLLTCGTTYYWQVAAENCCGGVRGPVWSFSTSPCPCAADGDCDDGDACTADACVVDACANVNAVSCPVGQACVPAGGTCQDITPPCTGNLVIDGGFELAADVWDKGANSGRIVVTDVYRSGLRSQRIFFHRQFTREVTQDFAAPGGMRYQAAGWIQTVSVTGAGASLQVLWLDGQQALRTDIVGTLGGTQSWTRFSAVLDAPAGATAARVVMFTDVDDGAMATAWFDDIEFCAVAACCDVPLASCVPCPCAAPGQPVLYVSNALGQRIAALDANSGALLASAIDVLAGSAISPSGLAFGDSGDLYAGNLALGGIRSYAPSAAPCDAVGLVDFGTGLEPAGMAAGPDGQIYISDSAGGLIRRFDPALSAFDDTFELSGCGLASPADLIFRPDGMLLVSNPARKNVLAFNPVDGSCAVFAEECGLNTPSGLLLSTGGELLVANRQSNSVIRFDRCGQCLGAFVASGSCGLSDPIDLVHAPNGDVYVSSFGGGALLAFSGVDGSPVDRDPHLPGVQCSVTAAGLLAGPTYMLVTPQLRDCNANGIDDAEDIATATSFDCDLSLIPDECELPVGIIASDPPGGAIDARQPTDLNGNNPAGLASLTVTFNCDAACVSPADFSVSATGGAAPGLMGIEVSGAEVTLLLDAAIPLAEWTMITHVPSDSRVCLGYLPGDVSGNGVTSATDILALVDHLNGIRTRPIYATDINRNGTPASSDIIRVIDLLNGASAFDPWQNRMLPPNPCP